MLKRFSIFIMAIAISYAAGAQKTAAPEIAAESAPFSKMEFGVHGGPGYSIFFNQRPMLNPRNNSRPPYSSFAAGVSYQYNFTKMVGLHIETNYERKGDFYYLLNGWDNQGTFTSSSAYDRISYITVPVTARFSFGKRIRFFLDGGMYAGVTISAQRIMSDSYYSPGADVVYRSQQSNTDLTKDVSTMDGGVVMGAGVLLPIGKLAAFTVQARNNTGFVNQAAKTDLYIGRFYNNSTNLMLGLTFFLDQFKDGSLKIN